MRGVDLHTVETCAFGELCRVGEALDHFSDHCFVHRQRRGETLGQVAQLQRHRRGCPGRLAQVGLHLPAGMVDLQPELRAFGTADRSPALEPGQLRFVFQHHATGAGHGAAVDHHVAGNQQAGAALGPALVKAHQVLGWRVLAIRHVLFHRRLGEAVGDDRAIGQDKGIEQGHGCFLG